MKDIDGSVVLAIRFYCDDLGKEVSIGEYLIELLTSLWSEGEGFSGKRPFGNSGWENDLRRPLVSAGLVWGELDSDGYLEDYDADAADEAIFAAIDALRPPVPVD